MSVDVFRIDLQRAMEDLNRLAELGISFFLAGRIIDLHRSVVDRLAEQIDHLIIQTEIELATNGLLGPELQHLAEVLSASSSLPC